MSSHQIIRIMSDYESDDYELEMEHQEMLDAQRNEMMRAEHEEELRWDLNEMWGKSLPDGFTLRNWERSGASYVHCFHTNTLSREMGKRGYGSLRVSPGDWKLLKTSAERYAKTYNVREEPIMCCMAEWYLKH